MAIFYQLHAPADLSQGFEKCSPVHADNLSTVPRSSSLLRIRYIDYAIPTSTYCIYHKKYRRTRNVGSLTNFMEHNPL
jgi:hypothetical protein